MQVSDVGSWRVFVNHNDTVDPVYADAWGLAVQLAREVLGDWRDWAGSSGVGGFGVEAQLPPTYETVAGQAPWESDQTFKRFGAHVDFVDRVVAYLDDGNPVMLYPSKLSVRTDATGGDPPPGSAEAYLDSSSAGFWHEVGDEVSTRLHRNRLGLRTILWWWERLPGNSNLSSTPSLTLGEVRRYAHHLVDMAATLIHEIGHIVFHQIFRMVSSDDISGEPYAIVLPNGAVTWKPNHCEGPQFSTVPFVGDSANRLYKFPEDLEEGVSRHWCLVLMQTLFAGLLRNDVPARVSQQHIACCARRNFPEDYFAPDPPWYGGLDWCPDLPPDFEPPESEPEILPV